LSRAGQLSRPQRPRITGVITLKFGAARGLLKIDSNDPDFLVRFVLEPIRKSLQNPA